MIEVTCAVIGHRPKSFPWKYNETTPDCVLPCKGQTDSWSASVQERYFSIPDQTDGIVYVRREYHKSCMLERSRYLVDHVSFLLAVCNGTWRSDTGATVRYAQKLNREFIVINPDMRTLAKLHQV